jgi:predicted nucleotidyltransferase
MYGLPDHAIGKVNDIFSKYPFIEEAVLYGSRAKGTYKNGSDIDITLKGQIPIKGLLHIENELDDLLLPWMIDLSIYNHIDNPGLIDHIRRVGKVLYKC